MIWFWAMTLVLTTLVACSNDVAKYSIADISGSWRLYLPAAQGQVELSQLGDDDIGGTLTLNSYVWSLTGSVADRPLLQFYLLPSHDEAVIFSALGFAIPDGPSKPVPTHAADKLAFLGEMSSDGRKITGHVTAALSNEQADFELSR